MSPRRWPPLIAAGLLLLGLAGYTGSSYGYWGMQDPLLSPPERARHELAGFPRGIRSDEWAVDLPLARVQQIARPSFPLVNLDLGLGHLQRNPFDAPVLDWGLAFRPHLWPLLAGSWWSHGVRWFLRSALLILGLYGWTRALADDRSALPAERRRRADVAALGAIALFASGCLNWWLSHAYVEIVAFSGLFVFAAGRAVEARGARARWGWTAAAAYLSACAFFNFYPPVWAPLLWIACGTVVDLAWRREHHPLRAAGRALPLIVAIGLGAVLSVLYFAPYLALVVNTIYPGSRVAVAGELPAGRLTDMLWPSLEVAAPLRDDPVYRGFVPGMNVCEASCVEALPFFLLGILALVRGPVHEAVRRVLRASPATAFACALLAAWLLLPLPAWVGTATLLRFTPWHRAWMPFGVACALLATAGLAELEAVGPRQGRPWREVLLAAALLALSWTSARRLVTLDRTLVVAASLSVALTLAACALLGTRHGARALAVAWALPLVLVNAPVNPLLPTSALYAKGAGHAVVDAALRERPGRIADYTATMGSVLAAHGWPVLTSLQTVPDLDLYRFLAPDSPGLTRAIYDRYAHVRFALPPKRTLEEGDVVEVSLSPCSARLAALGVNHVLTTADAALPLACAATFDVRGAGSDLLWSRKIPVGGVGVARGEAPSSALDFDFSVGAAETRVTRRRDGLDVEVSPGERRAVALPLNLGVVERVTCARGCARTLDAHLVVQPEPEGGARCHVRFLGTRGGLKRLLHPEAPRVELIPPGCSSGASGNGSSALAHEQPGRASG